MVYLTFCKYHVFFDIGFNHTRRMQKTRGRYVPIEKNGWKHKSLILAWFFTRFGSLAVSDTLPSVENHDFGVKIRTVLSRFWSEKCIVRPDLPKTLLHTSWHFLSSQMILLTSKQHFLWFYIDWRGFTTLSDSDPIWCETPYYYIIRKPYIILYADRGSLSRKINRCVISSSVLPEIRLPGVPPGTWNQFL